MAREPLDRDPDVGSDAASEAVADTPAAGNPAPAAPDVGPTGYAGLTDEQLMDRVRDRDDMVAFGLLYERCNADLVDSLAVRFGRGVAEEAAQRAWWRVWERRARWRQEGE